MIRAPASSDGAAAKSGPRPNVSHRLPSGSLERPSAACNWGSIPGSGRVDLSAVWDDWLLLGPAHYSDEIPYRLGEIGTAQSCGPINRRVPRRSARQSPKCGRACDESASRLRPQRASGCETIPATVTDFDGQNRDQVRNTAAAARRSPGARIQPDLTRGAGRRGCRSGRRRHGRVRRSAPRTVFPT